MKFIFLSFLMLVSFYPLAANAKQTISESQTDKYCRIFAKHPEKFRQIKLKENCEYEDVNAQTVKARCFSYKIDGSKETARYTIKPESGTCSSSYLAKFSDASSKDAIEMEILNSSENGYGFGDYDVPVEFEGQLFVTNSRQSNLRKVVNNGEIVLCEIQYDFLKWEKPKKPSDVCSAFSSGKYSIAENHVSELTLEDVQSSGVSRVMIPAANSADIDGDGHDEKIITKEFASGAGCGCGDYSMTIAPSNNAHNAELKNALQTLTESDCQSGKLHYWSVFIIDRKPYIANMPLPSFFQNGKMYSDYPFSNATLYQYQNGDFEEVCNLNAISPRKMDRDITGLKSPGYTLVK